MDRREIIKALMATMWVTVLPLRLHGKANEKRIIYKGYVAGFQYWSGPDYENYIKAGDPLELVREPENEHDNKAIAIYWNKVKVGYIPKRHNLVLKNMMDQKMTLQARVRRINLEAKNWERLRAEVRV